MTASFDYYLLIHSQLLRRIQLDPTKSIDHTNESSRGGHWAYGPRRKMPAKTRPSDPSSGERECCESPEHVFEGRRDEKEENDGEEEDGDHEEDEHGQGEEGEKEDEEDAEDGRK